MGVIKLEGLEYFSHHGYHHEEQKLGNRYTVDIELHADVSNAAEFDQLDGTVNYEHIYKLISNVMKVNAKLLEHIAHQINEKVLGEISSVQKVITKVSKHNPPLKGICRVASVTLVGDR